MTLELWEVLRKFYSTCGDQYYDPLPYTHMSMSVGED